MSDVAGEFLALSFMLQIPTHCVLAKVADIETGAVRKAESLNRNCLEIYQTLFGLLHFSPACQETTN